MWEPRALCARAGGPFCTEQPVRRAGVARPVTAFIDFSIQPKLCLIAHVGKSGVHSRFVRASSPEAPRVIGTLKREYLLDRLFASEEQAREALTEAVRLYNQERPHQALGYATPAAVHSGERTREERAARQHAPRQHAATAATEQLN